MHFCKFHKSDPRWDPSQGRPPQKGPKLKMLLKIFHFWEIFDLGRPPTRIRPPEKSLYFSPSFWVRLWALIFFECAFKSSTIKGSAFPNPTSFWVCLRALTSFECAFEPSTIQDSAPSSPRPFKVVCFLTPSPFECAFEPSPLSSAPSSPRPIKVVRFLTLPPFKCALELSFPFERVCEPSFRLSFHLLNSAPSSPIMSSLEKFLYFGNPLQCDHPEKSLYFSTRQVTHYNVTFLKNPRIFPLVIFFHWAGNPLQCDQSKKSSYFSTGQVTLQCDLPEKSSYFSTRQVTHYNVTILKNPRIFPLGR